MTLSLSRDLQVYDLLRHDRLMLSKDAAFRLSELIAPNGNAEVEGESDAEIESAPAEGHVKPAATEAAKKPAHKAVAKKAAKPRAKAKVASAHKSAAKKPARAAKPKSSKGKGHSPKGKE